MDWSNQRISRNEILSLHKQSRLKKNEKQQCPNKEREAKEVLDAIIPVERNDVSQAGHP